MGTRRSPARGSETWLADRRRLVVLYRVSLTCKFSNPRIDWRYVIHRSSCRCVPGGERDRWSSELHSYEAARAWALGQGTSHAVKDCGLCRPQGRP